MMPNQGLMTVEELHEEYVKIWQANPDPHKFTHPHRLFVVFLALRYINMPAEVVPREDATMPELMRARFASRFGKDNRYKDLGYSVITKVVPGKKLEALSRPTARSHNGTVFHPVRSFLRHYKSGKTALVKAHWRGDPEKGIKQSVLKLVPAKATEEEYGGPGTA